MFFVATAPLSKDHHVNTSPKGYDSFRLVSSTECYYLDMTGSGNETISHVLENGRITISEFLFYKPSCTLHCALVNSAGL